MEGNVDWWEEVGGARGKEGNVGQRVREREREKYGGCKNSLEGK